MPSFNKLVIAATALATLVGAAPLNIPRDVTSTVTETAYTTVDVPVTLWVNEEGKPLSTEARGGNFAEQTPSSKLESSALPTTLTTTSASVQSPAAVVPTTTHAPQIQAPSPTTPPAAPTTPEYQAPAAPVVPSSSAAPAPEPSAAPTDTSSSGQSSDSITASDSASCQGEGAACEGDITHWDGGLGACGWDVNSNSDMQVALPVGFMGSQSNGNPYCGKSLTIRNPTTGKTVQATVGDKCMGCSGRSIDLTNALFQAIGSECDGRCSGFQWWLN